MKHDKSKLKIKLGKWEKYYLSLPDNSKGKKEAYNECIRLRKLIYDNH